MSYRRIAAGALFASPLLFAGLMPAATPDPVYTALRQAPLVDQMLVENLTIKREGGVLTLKSGSLGFTAPTLDRNTVAVFSGEGEFVFAAKAATEKEYYKSITGQETVREAFDRALFTFTDQTGKELRAQGKLSPAEAKLNEILSDYRKRLRNRSDTAKPGLEGVLNSESGDNIEADILADLYNASQPGFFNAWLHGRKHSDLRFFVRPRGAAQFLPSPEEVAVMNLDAGAAEDAIWYLGHLESEIAANKASSNEDKRTVRADSYKIDTEIAGNDHITATAELHFTAVNAGDRVVKFELLPNLRVTKVTAEGQEVAFIQEDRHEDPVFYVVLPKALEAGKQYALTMEYSGDKVVRKVGGGNFSVGARTSWYPSVNSFQDHALYDLTFKVPKRYTLVGVGKLVKEWKEKDSSCSEWTSEAPLAVAGFNYGEFVKKSLTDPKTGLVVEGYAASTVPDYLKEAAGESAGAMSPTRLNDRVMSEAQASAQIFSMYFGKSEFSRIAVSQQPAFNFGQSWPTLVYLPLSAYLDGTQRHNLGFGLGMSKFVDEVTSHEVSHQWWGHMVGWKSYRDQWLSEGFADFSASLYLQFTEPKLDAYLKYWRDHRENIMAKNEYGRRPNDAGPIWLGQRLDSFKNDNAYAALVYNKGGYVLHMLRQLMYDAKDGDKYFIETMQDFVKQYLNKSASTEDFKKVVEQHMRPSMNAGGNGKMDWFFNEWVYGTTIPRYKLDYTLEAQADGKCLLKGTLAQSEVPADFVMAVPIYADFDGQIARLGAARLVGSSSVPINVMLPKKPKKAMINARYDVLEQ
jgi:hypothetical protein